MSFSKQHITTQSVTGLSHVTTQQVLSMSHFLNDSITAIDSNEVLAYDSGDNLALSSDVFYETVFQTQHVK